MIQSIYVKNFVLIDTLSLDFNKSYSCFTGETGAGKSLLIDCIGILCGDRANASIIKKGAEKAFMELVMDVPMSHPSLLLLEERGFDHEDGVFSVSREINAEGKSVAKINGRTTTLSFVKEIMSSCIDIHSQHDNQYLLNNKYHLSLLDSYMKEDALLKDTMQAYSDYSLKLRQYNELVKEDFNEDDLDYLEYQVKEMDALDISENELEDLEAQQKEMAAYEKVSSKLQEAISIIESCRYESLYDVNKVLSDIDKEEVQASKEEILNAYYMLDEQRETLHTIKDSLVFDEYTYNEIQSRIFTIHKAFRKHGGSYTSYMKKKQEFEERIARIENKEQFLAKSEQELKQLHAMYLEYAHKLSCIRKDKALALEDEIHKELQDLFLENAVFKIKFEEQETKYGIDKVEFYIQMNVGSTLQPLNKVASGGELSRLMLGLKTIFSKLTSIDTIIFDEIDNGVSGNVAFAIGKKMHDIACDKQVFSVTHLAPVAAWASHHYYVSKSSDGNSTNTSIQELTEDSRIKELANIAQGSNNQAALDAARVLYESTK